MTDTFKIVAGSFLLLLAGGCQKHPDSQPGTAAAPMAVAASAPARPAVPAVSGVVAKDICWRRDITDAMVDDLGVVLNDYVTSLKGHFHSIDDVADSDASISAQNFGLISLDAGSGHVVCDADFSVSYATKSHGTIAVDNQHLEFEIKQTEAGQKVSVKRDSLSTYVQAFSEAMKKVTSAADLEKPGT